MSSRGSALALIVLMTLLFARTDYVIRAADHLDRVQTIAAPHLTETERLLYRSRAAQMEGKPDYVELLAELNSIAQANHSRVPEFAVF